MAHFGRAVSAVALLAALSASHGTWAQQVQTNYTYDVHGRLIAVGRPSTTTTYTYDNAGNRAHLNTASPNHSPVAYVDYVTVTAGQSVSFDPRTNDVDPDSDPLTVTGISTSTTSKGAISFTPTSITYAANAGQGSGTDVIGYTISDGRGGTSSSTFNVTINPVVTVTKPVLADSTANLYGNPIGNALPLSMSGSAPTSLNITQLPSSGYASVYGSNTISYTPTGNWSGQTALQYTATNSAGTSNTATVSINVAPVVGAVSGYAAPGQQTSLTLTPMTNYTNLRLSVLPAKGSYSISGTTLYYKAYTGQSGADTFSYVADSSGGTSLPASITFNINATTNHDPVAVNDTASTPFNTNVIIPVLNNDSDPDGDPLTVTRSDASLNGASTSFNSDGTVTYSPVPGFYGTDYFAYYIADGHGGTASAAVTVQVAPRATNQPPTANPHTTDPVWQNTTVVVTPLSNDTDPDGDALTIKSIDQVYFAYGTIDGVSLTSAPADIGTVTPYSNYFTYRAPILSYTGTPGSNYIAVVVWYTASDGHGGTSQSYEVLNVYGPQ